MADYTDYYIIINPVVMHYNLPYNPKLNYEDILEDSIFLFLEKEISLEELKKYIFSIYHSMTAILYTRGYITEKQVVQLYHVIHYKWNKIKQKEKYINYHMDLLEDLQNYILDYDAICTNIEQEEEDYYQYFFQNKKEIPKQKNYQDTIKIIDKTFIKEKIQTLLSQLFADHVSILDYNFLLERNLEPKHRKKDDVLKEKYAKENKRILPIRMETNFVNTCICICHIPYFMKNFYHHLFQFYKEHQDDFLLLTVSEKELQCQKNKLNLCRYIILLSDKVIQSKFDDNVIKQIPELFDVFCKNNFVIPENIKT